MSNSVYTVADIRKAIEGRSDDEVVHSQVVAVDGAAWTMACAIVPVFNFPKGLVIDMRHPQLETLPGADKSTKDEQIYVMRCSLELIALGESENPRLDADNALVASGIWEGPK